MSLFISKTSAGILVEKGHDVWILDTTLDELATRSDLYRYLNSQIGEMTQADTSTEFDLLAPIGSQEVWAAGVTYFRSRTARMEESESAGGSDFYDRVYQAERPELFLKATPFRVVGPQQDMFLRRDSNWMVPEPELTLLLSAEGVITGYTIGNDLSCRDIEGENPLYLPQAKTFDRCAAIGPRILISESPLSAETPIQISIKRGGVQVVTDDTSLSEMKKTLDDLAGYLFRASSFPVGCFLMTGTGIVPPDDFTLKAGDEVSISIPPIGTLTNTMRYPD